MLLSLCASSSRLPLSLPLPLRQLSTTARQLAKAPLAATSETPTPLDLLTKIGRGAEKRLAQHAESWEALNSVWNKGGQGIKDSGLGVRDRRYVLWAFSKYSQGESPSDFVRPPRAAKKFRG
ncbi:hypothetical protein EHS25_000158 [Saitozyma podzolica]|uniref:Small ribosomal subunit protein mS41 n=1 Tax=Saitozyma podzolica TaxID=1890683 RepID=A0A427YVG4_9TREE|nr:hypothetical protein EHS25_000158 [Saitozyma podzolica]